MFRFLATFAETGSYVRKEKIVTPKMQEAIDKLAMFPERGLPKGAFHHSTVTALLKGGAVEAVPGDATSIRIKDTGESDPAPLPRRNPEVAVIPIDDEVIGSVRHVTARPKAWIVNAAQTVADATSWVCRSRVKPTRVSRRRAQRLAMTR